MQYIALFMCMVGTVMAAYIRPPTTTRFGTRPINPRLSVSFYPQMRSVTKTPAAAAMKMYAPVQKWSNSGVYGVPGFRRGVRRRFRPRGVATRRRQSSRGLLGSPMMRALLPMIMANEGEGLNVLFLAQMIDQRRTSPHMKMFFLSGRFGKLLITKTCPCNILQYFTAGKMRIFG